MSNRILIATGLAFFGLIMTAQAQDAKGGQQASPTQTEQNPPAAANEQAAAPQPTTGQDAAKQEPAPKSKEDNKPPAESKAKASDSTKAKPSGPKALTPRQIANQEAARKRIERVKKEEREKLAKMRADPNYQAKLEEFKTKARIKLLKQLLQKEELKSQQQKLTRLGGRLKTKPPEVAKDVKKDAPKEAPKEATTATETKTSVRNPKPVLKLLADEVDSSDVQGENFEPLDILEQAKKEVDQAREMLLEAPVSELSDEELLAILTEEARASGVYLDALKLAKEYYSQIQAAVNADPSLAEGADLSVLPELLSSLDQSIAEEESLAAGTGGDGGMAPDQQGGVQEPEANESQG